MCHKLMKSVRFIKEQQMYNSVFSLKKQEDYVKLVQTALSPKILFS